MVKVLAAADPRDRRSPCVVFVLDDARGECQPVKLRFDRQTLD
jgi:hypothetical protein